MRPVGPPPAGSSDTVVIEHRMIAGMRLVLAASAFLIIALDPTEPDRYVTETYVALGAYVVWSGALLLLARHPSGRFAEALDHTPWFDVCGYTVLIALSRGTNSIFFFGFVFAALVASFRLGFWPTVRLVGVSVVAYTVVGVSTAPQDPTFEMNRFLLRPTYLLVLGYMMAYWGDFEIRSRRRLALLSEITRHANPRGRVSQALHSVLERTRLFFDADAALIVARESADRDARMWRATRERSADTGSGEKLPSGVAATLLAFPPESHVLARFGRRLPFRPRLVVAGAGAGEGRLAATADEVAALLGCSSFLSVPLFERGRYVGRGYVTAARASAFRESDLGFLRQVVDHARPSIENIRLVDQLAASAAESERRRIARDIHDSVVQPYVGLQLGLAAIQERIATGSGDVAGEVDRLARLARTAVSDLRHYVSELRSPLGQGMALVSAVQGFASRFREATGIEVEVEVPPDLVVENRLVSEIFQMVSEGLSNIRRHTSSGRARIRLAGGEGGVFLSIENDPSGGGPAPSFTPQSIRERALSLGGSVEVGASRDGWTVVDVRLPR